MTVDELIGILGKAKNRNSEVLLNYDGSTDGSRSVHRVVDLTHAPNAGTGYAGCFILVYKKKQKRGGKK